MAYLHKEQAGNFTAWFTFKVKMPAAGGCIIIDTGIKHIKCFISVIKYLKKRLCSQKKRNVR